MVLLRGREISGEGGIFVSQLSRTRGGLILRLHAAVAVETTREEAKWAARAEAVEEGNGTEFDSLCPEGGGVDRDGWDVHRGGGAASGVGGAASGRRRRSSIALQVVSCSSPARRKIESVGWGSGHWALPRTGGRPHDAEYSQVSA